MNIIEIIKTVISVLFAVFFAYRIFYIFVTLAAKKKRKPETDKTRRYAVITAARNEEEVIGQLLESIKKQTYPSSNIDMYVIADNCTDNTATEARAHGANVYERFNQVQRGKGYALDYLFTKMREDNLMVYDGYIVFDADNILMPDYIEEIDREYDTKYDAITSNCLAKNYNDNWISAGYGLCYLRESRLLDHPRSVLGVSCVVTGKGFMLLPQALERNNGWKFYTLTEDAEFSAKTIADGRKIGFCSFASFYDEQPTSFTQSWIQRTRWIKGYIQVFLKYGKDLLKRMFRRGSFSAWDMICCVTPAFFFALGGIVTGLMEFIACLCTGGDMMPVLFSSLSGMVGMYGGLYLLGLIATLTEWEGIRATAAEKLLYTVTYPLFMLTYIPISIACVFKKVEWVPIKHTRVVSVSDYTKR